MNKPWRKSSNRKLSPETSLLLELAIIQHQYNRRIGVIPLDIFLDIALLVFHCGLIAFNCFGMLWRRTRLANLVTLMLTGLSWTLLGIWYGLGYCPLTDWHWQVKARLGVTGLPNSYLKWLVDAPTGWDVNAVAVDWVAGVVFAGSLGLSVWMNVRDWRRGGSKAEL